MKKNINLINGIGFRRMYLLNLKFGIKNKKFYYNFLFLNYIYYVNTYFKTDINLKEIVFYNIKNLKVINCYKGFRHKLRLRVNGQRLRNKKKWIKEDIY